ncbi:hypothetical protein ASF64_13275 [Arthrobacter sp. Leaf137]|nr:hypothetical protein ASF64_13275 [Arthrobacter sp. Leaf137]
MAFPLELTAVLSGATARQLRLWRGRGILVPEINRDNPALYSYRDVVALRTIAFLRSRTSMQNIGKAFHSMQKLQFTEHPATYSFGLSGTSIVFKTPEGITLDLSRNVGQMMLFTLEEIFEPYTNRRNETVVDFRHPKPHIEVDRGRLGGWPTIERTRISYDTIASLVDGDTVRPEEVAYYYPNVSEAAAQDAVDFASMVKAAAA